MTESAKYLKTEIFVTEACWLMEVLLATPKNDDFIVLQYV